MNWPQRNVFRKSTSYWVAGASELAAPLLRAYARSRVSSPATPPETWRKALLIGVNHIGDVLYRSSSLPALKEGLPQCEFDFVAPAPACEVLEGNPCLRRIHAFDLPKSSRSPEAEILRQEKYDAVICYDSGMPWKLLKLAVDLGIPNRVSNGRKGFSAWITYPIAVRHPQTFAAYFRDMVAQIIRREPDWSLKPIVPCSEQDRHEANALWQEFSLNSDQPVLACFVTTRQQSGAWPAVNYLETLRSVKKTRPTAQIILCGAPADAGKLAQLRADLKFDCPINAGRLGLRALVAFLEKCDAVFSADSGPRHLANAADTPVVFVRNPWFRKSEAGCYCVGNEHDLAPDIEEIPLSQQSSYLNQITPAIAAAEIEKILSV